MPIRVDGTTRLLGDLTKEADESEGTDESLLGLEVREGVPKDREGVSNSIDCVSKLDIEPGIFFERVL